MAFGLIVKPSGPGFLRTDTNEFWMQSLRPFGRHSLYWQFSPIANSTNTFAKGNDGGFGPRRLRQRDQSVDSAGV
jgi:hypothetical protein